MKATLATIGISFVMCGCMDTSIRPSANLPVQERSTPPAPSLTLSVNFLSESVIASGSPILIEVVLSTADGRDSGTPVSIANDAGPWSEMINLEIRDSRDQVISSLGFQPLFTTDNAIALNQDTLGIMSWAVTAEAENALPPGEYSVVAVLTTESSAQSEWKGKTSSGPTPLTVKATRGELSVEQIRLITLAEARINSYLGDFPAAHRALDAFLAEHPTDGLVLEEKADTLARSGDLAEALATYDRAIANVPPQEGSLLREPPHLLIQKRKLAGAALKESSTH